MLNVITRQANHVDEKIQRLSATSEEPVSKAHFFSTIATPEDVLVVIGEEDFLQAKSEFVGSVSAKELEHCQRVREKFEVTEEKGKKGKGKVIEKAAVGEEEDAPAVDWKVKGKALRVDRDAGVEVEDIRLQLRSRLEPCLKSKSGRMELKGVNRSFMGMWCKCHHSRTSDATRAAADGFNGVL